MCEVLKGLATSVDAAAAVVGTVISIIVQLWPGWENWERKREAVLIVCLVVPLLGLVLGAEVMACEGMVITLMTVAVAVRTGIEVFIASQGVYHILVKKYIARH